MIVTLKWALTRRFLIFYHFRSHLFVFHNIEIICHNLDSKGLLGEVETGNYEELAEDEETFVDELGVKETSDMIEDLVGEEVKLENEDKCD